MLCTLRACDFLLANSDSKNCTLVVTTMGMSQFSAANFSFAFT